MTASEHDGKTVTCSHGPTVQEPTTLEYGTHGSFVRSLKGTDRHGTPLRDRYAECALRFDCPVCGDSQYVCPVCSDPDEHTPPGWFIGESSGVKIPCHNCNADEVARNERRG